MFKIPLFDQDKTTVCKGTGRKEGRLKKYFVLYFNKGVEVVKGT